VSLHTPTVLEIDRKLRDDFRRRVKDFGVNTDTTDPLLAVLFRTVAQQIDQVYGDTAQMRQHLLHELMHGLHLQTFLARPAQAVVRLRNDFRESRTLRSGTEVNAVASTGERLVFTSDDTVEISQAQLGLALAYGEQSVRLLSGVETSEPVQALRPSLDPIPVNLGPQPALFLAFENVPDTMLSRHGIFFELGPGNYAVEHALSHEPWWIFDREGELTREGLLRPTQAGGSWRLVFQADFQEQISGHNHLPTVPGGFYSGRQFVLPSMPSDERFLCRAPRILEAALGKILGRSVQDLLSTQRVWLKIPMPPGLPPLHHAINDIVLHTMTVSNVFVRNQTIQFGRDGVSVPVTKSSGMAEHLVAPLTVMSTENEAYLAGNRLGASPALGRFEVANGRVTIYPGSHADGSRHTAANLRLWLTNGALGNRVGPGDITGFANTAALAGVHIAAITAAAGGSDGEEIASEERRFADALLTRGRIVTETDLKTAALAVDRRILNVSCSSALERRQGTLRRVERLLATLDSFGFSKPEIELPVLKAQLERALGARLVQGLLLEVSFAWS
jgi:hypothetical protein